MWMWYSWYYEICISNLLWSKVLGVFIIFEDAENKFCIPCPFLAVLSSFSCTCICISSPYPCFIGNKVIPLLFIWNQVFNVFLFPLVWPEWKLTHVGPRSRLQNIVACSIQHLLQLPGTQSTAVFFRIPPNSAAFPELRRSWVPKFLPLSDWDVARTSAAAKP